MLCRLRIRRVDAHAVPTDVHLFAVAVDHVHALGPGHVHMVLAVVHVNATGPEVHLAAALLFEVNALGCLGITCIANATALWRSRLFRSFRDDNPARATHFRAVGGLKGHIILDGLVHVQKLVQRHPVELRQGNEVVGVRRRL